MAKQPKKDVKPSNEVSTWLSEIERAQKTPAMSTWHERCEKIRKKYLYEQSQTAKSRQYQMLWSNMETMKPSIYTKPPKGVVQQRWKDRDQVANSAVEMLERGINFTLDANDFNSAFEQVRDNYLLYARAQVRLKYKPEFDTVDHDDGEGDPGAIDPAEDTAIEAKEPEAAVPGTSLKFENVNIEFLHRKDFVHSISRTWNEVTWCAFRAYLDRDDLVDRFGEEIGNKIPLDAGPDAGGTDRDKGNASVGDDKATIWEIWDKSTYKVLWIAVGHPDVLESGKPYLKLSGFFPCPRPAYGTLTTDSLVPVPDYIFYADQAEEVNTLTARIGSLTESLKLVGFYPAGPKGEGSPEIERAVRPGFENRMIAVQSWAAFVSGGGKEGVPIAWLPVDQVSNILKACVELRKQLIDDIYQIYGLSDIMRGDGNAQETATAQSIKAQYGSVRIRERQAELARFCRDVCRMTGEILATQFSGDTLMQMANMKLPTQADLDAQALQQAIQQLQQQAQAQREQELQQQAMNPQMGGMMGHNGPPPGGLPMQPGMGQ